MLHFLTRALVLATGMLSIGSQLTAMPWMVSYQNTVDLITGGFSVAELSGVTPYLLDNMGRPTFLAISDEGGQITHFEVDYNPNGINSATAVNQWNLTGDPLDGEGVAFHPSDSDSVFVAYERVIGSGQSIPGVRQYDLAGQQLQSVTVPAIWTTPGNVRNNRGFESLARSPAGHIMWTANEEALTIDGPASSQASSTNVRLQKFAISGSAVTSTSQFVYEVDPVHGPMPDRSGLVELVVLPDGNLLALERSAAVTLPVFENRIYQIDLSGATDVSDPAFDNGLSGTNYTPVTKNLLWSGSVSGLTGANMEGLTVVAGTNNDWQLIGVVDNGGGTNNNLVVSFELAPPNAYADFDRDGVFGCSDIDSLILEIIAGTDDPTFDLNGDGQVNGDDQTEWLAAAGVALDFGGPILPSDANLDGLVDGQDFVTRNNNKFTTNSSWCNGNFNHDTVIDGQDFVVWNDNKFSFTPVPEPAPTGCYLLAFALMGWRSHRLYQSQSIGIFSNRALSQTARNVP